MLKESTLNVFKDASIMMIGFPGSGKSTLARSLGGRLKIRVVSTDEIRLLNFGSYDYQGDDVFALADAMVKGCHRVVYDATNLRREYRTKFLSLHRDKKWVGVIVPTPLETCVERCAERKERQVPEEVFSRMVESYNQPLLSEGFDTLISSTAILEV